MNHIKTIILSACFCISFGSCESQKPFGTDQLVLEKSIPLQNVHGRIDHLDINRKGQLVYIAALGNNSLEVVDIRNGRHVHTINGLDEPQGIAYIPQHNEIFVSNGGNGKCYFFNATSYQKSATIDLSSDADDVRYDSVDRRIYVGYGKGGIAIIDADNHKLVGDIKLSGHPEGFQIDKALLLLYVNVPGSKTIVVIDLKNIKVKETWSTSDLRDNFPMAVDSTRHRIFIGYRRPAKLIMLDGKTGKEISRNDMVGDVDDVYYNDVSKEVLVSGGAGYINIFREDGIGAETEVANIPTNTGARTSLLIPESKVFVLAVRETANTQAQMEVYRLK